jgi:DNA-binding GntR family transcriptional regulator
MPAGRQRARTSTKQQQLYEALRERILSGAYGPGYRVVIDTVAEEFGVSALPVREAIRRLEAEGLIVYRPNAGAQVTPADPEQFEDDLALLAVLEGYATALAADRLTGEDIALLRARTDEMNEAMEQMDSLAFGRLNREFHALIYARCPNPSVVAIASDVERRLDAIRRTVFLQIPYRGSASVREHRALIELLQAGAPADEIERAAREHKLHTLDSFRQWRSEHDPAR